MADALFLAHGSPMNALEDNLFTRKLAELGKQRPSPSAIVCISAHWLSAGTWVTQMARPRTIHDFYGFPKELYEVQYPAPGSRELAEKIRALGDIHGDEKSWGLDHGTWSVLRHLYPEANIPVVQLSIDMSEPPRYHYELGKKLRPLRDENVLVIGSGNIVHNLRQIRWEENAEPFSWATQFDAWVRDRLLARDFEPLIDDFAKSESGRLSVPAPDHYYPLLYVLGAVDERDRIRFEFEGIQAGSISMRTVSFGR